MAALLALWALAGCKGGAPVCDLQAGDGTRCADETWSDCAPGLSVRRGVRDR